MIRYLILGYTYATKFTVENPFDKPIRVQWRTNDQQLKQKYFTDSPRSYVIQPNTKMVISPKLRFEEPVSKDKLKSMVKMSAKFVDGDNSVLLNSDKEMSLDAVLLEPSKRLSDSKKMKVTLPPSMYSDVRQSINQINLLNLFRNDTFSSAF